MTVGQLVEHLQLPLSTLQGTVKRAKHKKLIRVAGWYTRVNRGGPRWLPMYGLGGNPDKPRPDALTGAEKSADYRDRNRAVINAKKRAKRGSTVNPFLDLIR